MPIPNKITISNVSSPSLPNILSMPFSWTRYQTFKFTFSHETFLNLVLIKSLIKLSRVWQCTRHPGTSFPTCPTFWKWPITALWFLCPDLPHFCSSIKGGTFWYHHKWCAPGFWSVTIDVTTQRDPQDSNDFYFVLWFHLKPKQPVLQFPLFRLPLDLFQYLNLL